MRLLEAQGSGLEQALARTARADGIVRRVLRRQRRRLEGLAVLAAGGYGRSDLSSRSDLDLVILHDGDLGPREEVVRHLVQRLWDGGLRPGQTLLDLDEIAGPFLAIPDRASALLEARLLSGDRDLVHRFEERLNDRFDGSVWARFVRLKREEFAARRESHGDVVRVVEPHVKAQAGGLRDLHHVLWLERAAAALGGRWSLRKRRGSGVRALAGRLLRAGMLASAEREQMLEAYDLLLRVRDALHDVAGRGEDRLGVELQPEVASRLGFRGDRDEQLRGLMREVYRAGAVLARFADELGEDIVTRMGSEEVPPSGPARLVLSRRQILRAARDPGELVRVVDRSVEQGAPLAPRSRLLLRRRLHDDPAEERRLWAGALEPWLERREGLGPRLRCLDDLDAIHLWLPPWRGIAGLSTGSYYHRYAVDEHTLRAVEMLDRLPGDGPEGLPASLWRVFEPPMVVYLALLFHDIAKGRGEPHGEVGAELAEHELERLGWGQWAAAVARLVRLHLRMEQVAFRRDPRDPEVVARFAEEVGSEFLLQGLYLVTICDLAAVAPHVWTGWKARLLAELYLETRDWFERGARARSVTAEAGADRVAAHDHGRQLERERVVDFLASMREEYRRVVPPDEIALHLEEVERVRGGEVKSSWIVQRATGYLVLTLVTRDRIGLLAQAAGLLVTHGIGIREARIFTREDGIVLDRFRAEDLEPEGVPLQERIAGLQAAWGELEAGELHLGDLFARWRRRRRLQRPRRAAVVESTVEIRPAPRGQVLVDVAGPDTDGLLHRLCAVMVDARLDVRAARVAARVDGIHDSFLVRDETGLLKTEEGRRVLARRLRQAFDEEAP